jgi:ABC-type Zn uptake system ZnuABC Zn-binding protein ZnuA
MKKIAILMAAVMVMLIAAGCVTTTPEKNYQAVAKPKSCN